MKFLKYFVILGLVIITFLTLVIEQKTHKSFVLVMPEFKLKINEQYKEEDSQISLLFKLSDKTEEKFYTDTTHTIKNTDTAFSNNLHSNQLSGSKYVDEKVAWNEWRSNLQNRIMDDALFFINNNELGYEGTGYQYSFEVDRYGNISKLKVTCSEFFRANSIKIMREMILGLQGDEILDFPIQSQRKTTKFSGEFTISSYKRRYTPDDYNDYEKIKHKY